MDVVALGKLTERVHEDLHVLVAQLAEVRYRQAASPGDRLDLSPEPLPEAEQSR